MIELFDIEHALTQQGHFCLLDWLINRNHIVYVDYEKWRYGEISTFDTRLRIKMEQLEAIVVTATALSQKLHLYQQPQEYYAWSQAQRNPLKASQNAQLHLELTQQWIRPQDLPQMDLFMDNSAVVAENRLLEALSAREFDNAQAQLKKLTELNSKHEKLGQYQDLINYGYHMSADQIPASHMDTELAALENEVIPLAKTALKHQARDYLAFAWRRLDQNLQGQPFDPAQEKNHRSYVLMQIPDWEAAANSLADEKDQYRQAILLQRTAQCCEALKNDHKALLCWCLLMELDEDKCEAAIETKVSTMIWNLWQDFLDEYDGAPRAFFPAYLLIKRPGLVHQRQDLPPLRTAASTAVLEGILAHLAKEDDIPARKKMHAISPTLLKIFMGE